MFKTSNVGNLDRILRLVIGAALIVARFFYSSPIWLNPVYGWGALIIGAVLVFTALFRFCPLYRIIGVNTCKIG